MKSQRYLPRDVLKTRSSANMLQIYRRTPMLKLQSNFIEIALWDGCSPVNFLYIFRPPFPENSCGWLLLKSHQSISSYLNTPALICFFTLARWIHAILSAYLHNCQINKVITLYIYIYICIYIYIYMYIYVYIYIYIDIDIDIDR